ncbi:MAG: hypothetical protein HY518_04270 [Candidatus Aenigmarchaeota archaeon]|nr:hypothetical protein [Candidatus Aenigmarchaeota archaeon]
MVKETHKWPVYYPAIIILVFVGFVYLWLTSGSLWFGYFATAGMITLGLIFLYLGFHNLKMKKMIENIPTSKIRSLAMGLVEVHGRVVPIKSLKAPFSGRQCAYYYYSVEDVTDDKEKYPYGSLMIYGHESEPFLLKDETGSVTVLPEKAIIEMPIGISTHFILDLDYGKTMPENIKSFLKFHDITLSSHRRLRFREFRIDGGDMIYVIGTAGNNPFVKMSSKGIENVAITKGAHDKIFFISKSREWKIIKTCRAGSIVGIVAGVVFILSAVAMAFYPDLFFILTK